LQVLSRSQVTPELSMSMRIRPICKSLHVHTYTQRCSARTKPSATAGHSAMLTAFVSPEVQRLMPNIAQSTSLFQCSHSPAPITWPSLHRCKVCLCSGRPSAECGPVSISRTWKGKHNVLIYSRHVRSPRPTSPKRRQGPPRVCTCA
jgi:hypothetical protein